MWHLQMSYAYILRTILTLVSVHCCQQPLIMPEPWTCIWQNKTLYLYMWKKIYSNNFPRLPLINIYVYISVKCMIYHFLHRTLHKVKNTHCFSLCNKAWISWSRKRSLKQQLIQPINGVVSLIMIRLYMWQGKQEKSTSGNPRSSLDCQDRPFHLKTFPLA